MSNNETGKCEKAIKAISAIKKQKEGIDKYLSEAHDLLHAIVEDSAICTLVEKEEKDPWGSEKRIKFTVNDLGFHIDFLFAADGQDIEGVIVYGTSRKACYQDTRFPGAEEEEKALMRFVVDDLGKICAEDKLSDEWWLTVAEQDNKKVEQDNKKMVSDLHFRALDLIWRDALNWRNENLMP